MLFNLFIYQYNIMMLVLIQIIIMDTRDVIGATQKTDVQSKVDLLVQNVNNKKKKEKKKN